MRTPFLLFISIIFSSLAIGQNINTAILEEIKLKAIQSHSDAIIIMKEDSIIYEHFYDEEERPIYIASAGKSLVSMAIGKLIKDKKLDSLDQPVSTLFPEWLQGNKKLITIRMLLNHTSGIQNYDNASLELEPPPTYQIDDIIQLALAAELSNFPGEKVSYNNKAVALLGGIIEKASGKSMDQYFMEEFYQPLGINQYDWIKDRAGNPTAHGAFMLKPSDLLKFGQLMLNQGNYNGHQLLDKSWVKTSFDQGQEFTPIWGLLWWRLPEFEHRIIDKEIIAAWENAGVDQKFMDRVKPICHNLFKNKQDFYQALKKHLGADWVNQMNQNLPDNLSWSQKIFGEKIIAYSAEGHRGNNLVIIPEHKIVAVRCADAEGFNYETDFFNDFVSLIAQLGE